MAARIKTLSLYGMALFYFIAGANHFIDPNFYLPLIPQYLPYPEVINAISGLIEMIFGLGLIFSITRFYAALGIILMLLAFIPSHVYFIQIGGCIQEGLCAPVWIGWVRLILVHPLLIYWAWTNRH